MLSLNRSAAMSCTLPAVSLNISAAMSCTLPAVFLRMHHCLNDAGQIGALTRVEFLTPESAEPLPPITMFPRVRIGRLIHAGLSRFFQTWMVAKHIRIVSACHLNIVIWGRVLLTLASKIPPSVSMVNHRYPWLTMDIRGYPWISLGNHEYPWLTMDIHG